jgi:TfoX/Sxy family transcriptional regulator of competence genes
VEIPKPSDEDKAYFQSLVPDDPRVEVKPMFGNLGGFVNGNMFMGLFGADVGVKLAGADRDRLLAEDGAGPFGPEERPMAGYVTLPASWRAGARTKKAVPWIAKSLEQVGALPPKVAKKKGVRTAPGRGRGASAPRRGGG